MRPILYSLGHSRHAIATLCALIADTGVTLVADVRRFPVSRRHPQYNLGPLQAALATAGVDYVHLPALGGRHSDVVTATHSNAAIEDPGLRSYADYAQSAAFTRALGELLDRARRQPTAMLCAEADWRHCHRRIIADYTLQAGIEVRHLALNRDAEAARLDPLALIAADGTLHYPARQGGLFS